MSEITNRAELQYILSHHQAIERPTHCDRCGLRWPCEIASLADSHLAALDEIERLRKYPGHLRSCKYIEPCPHSEPGQPSGCTCGWETTL